VKKPEPAKPAAEQPAVVKKTDRDARKVWHDSMAAGQFKPRNVIAVADLLAHCEKFDEAAELLKADLRHGVLAHPCVFDALAIALQGSGAAVEEVERARLSQIDLEPENPQNYIAVAVAMHELGRSDRALEYCKRAAALEPNSAEAYQQTLVVAPKAGEPGEEAIRWAAGNLLSRDWGSDGAAVHQQAKNALEQLSARLAAAGKPDQAVAIRTDLARSKQRDLVIEALWTDPADVDLIVNEPVGTVCSVRTPRTPAGGLWSGDALGQNTESYVAAEAFPGSYELVIRRIWGEPMGGKVTIKVTKHAGGANESVELHTVTLDAKGEGTLKVQLADGRRTQSDSVPVGATVKRLPVAKPSREEVYSLLRSMADPMLATSGKPGVAGGSSAAGAMPATGRAQVGMEPGVELTHQTKVKPALTSGVDLLTRTTISSDRSTMTISLNPAFDSAAGTPRVPLAAVPGGK
jgi:tetratricopeptide (TPR) repeat protein